jgi:hypothetical protein
LTPLNKHVDDMNSRILQMNLGEEHVYYSADYFAEEAAELEMTCQMFGLSVDFATLVSGSCFEQLTMLR